MRNIKTSKNRKTSSTAWLQRHINDLFVQKSKKDGYRSRAAYKLIEIDEKFHILSCAKNILDLGAAPGSWSQVVQQKCKQSKIIALDLLPIEKLNDNVICLQGDFTNNTTINTIISYINKFDLILSDIAPNTTGHNQTDHLIIMNICNSVIDFAINNLAFNGNLIIKFFQGSEDILLFKRIKQYFNTTKIFKPISSRKESVEKYIIALGFKVKT